MKVYANLFSHHGCILKGKIIIFLFLEGENSTSDVQQVQAVGKRPLISKSVVWDYFRKLPQDSDKAQCNICSESLKHSLNTSNLFKVCK